MTPEQWDFCLMLSHPCADMHLEDLTDDFAVLIDPWEKGLVLDDAPDEFIAVRWIHAIQKYYAGRGRVMRPCFPVVAQVWVGEGHYADLNSHMKCVFFDDPEYDDYWRGEIK